MKILYGLLMLIFTEPVQGDTTGTVVDERVKALEQENILFRRTVASQQQDIVDLKNTLAFQHQTIAELTRDIVELKRTLVSQRHDTDAPKDASTAQKDEEQLLNTQLNTPKKRFVLDTLETVAFEATIAGANLIEHSHVHDRLLFESVSLNVGNGYHSGNGTFIAPVGGIYIFSTSVMMHGANTKDQGMHVILEKNGVEIAGAFAYNQGTYEHSSVTAAMALQPGDSVFVSVERHDDITFYGDRLTSFMGFLLFPI